jgi:hypothetical protein
MNKRHLSPRFPCPLASELGIPRNCMRNLACQRCAFAEWVDDTRPERAFPSDLETGEGLARAA